MSTFSQLNFKFGQCKLQATSATRLDLTSHDGGNILVQNVTTGQYYPIALGPGGSTGQELFNGTAFVEGVANQSLASNTLYSVYLKDIDGNETRVKMDFYRTFSGYNPTVEGNGLFVGNTGGPNIGLMYLGQVYTDNNNVTSVLAPAKDLKHRTYSHFLPWTFGFQTTTQVIKMRQATDISTLIPTILTVSEGISEGPEAYGSINFYSDKQNDLVTYQIEVSGTAIDGAGGSVAWSSLSPIQYATIGHTYNWQQLSAFWASAPPIGVFTIKPVITYSGTGNLVVRTQLCGRITL